MKINNNELYKIKKYIKNPKSITRLSRKTIAILMLSQIINSIGLGAGITVGTLLVKEIVDSNQFAGLATVFYTIGSSIAALLIGFLSQRYGRRIGLVNGLIIGGIGAIGVVMAAKISSIILLFVSLLVYGFGATSNLQARYAGSDLVKPKHQEKAISVILLTTTIGAILGPILTNVMANVAEEVNLPYLAGPFILSALVYLISGMLLFIFLRPDPLLTARIIKEYKNDDNVENKFLHKFSYQKSKIIIGSLVMIVAQLIMVSIMTMTPVYMKENLYNLNNIAFIISFHVAGLYLPSLVSGYLVARFGCKKIAISSNILLLIPGLIISITPQINITILLISLTLIGVGWNFAVISGTTYIVKGTNIENRPKIQGFVDVFFTLSGAIGAFFSGVIVENFNFVLLPLFGSILSVIVIFIIKFHNRTKISFKSLK